jgi:DNA-binding transcriptional MerR regulator
MPVFHIAPAAKRAGISERTLRNLLDKQIIDATKIEGEGNHLWFTTDEIATARIAGLLAALGMNTTEILGFVGWLRDAFKKDQELVVAARRGDDIALKIAPRDEAGPLDAELEKPTMNGSVPMVSMIHPQTIVLNLARVFELVQRDDRKFVRDSFKPRFVVRKEQRPVITRMLETHNPEEVKAFFAEAAEAAANGDVWK